MTAITLTVLGPNIFFFVFDDTKQALARLQHQGSAFHSFARQIWLGRREQFQRARRRALSYTTFTKSPASHSYNAKLPEKTETRTVTITVHSVFSHSQFPLLQS
ncbi:unnamed protein product [Ixodes persulcatus]